MRKRKIMYLSIPCIPPTTSKEKKCPKSVVLVHKVCCLEYKMWAKFVMHGGWRAVSKLGHGKHMSGECGEACSHVRG